MLAQHGAWRACEELEKAVQAVGPSKVCACLDCKVKELQKSCKCMKFHPHEEGRIHAPVSPESSSR